MKSAKYFLLIIFQLSSCYLFSQSGYWLEPNSCHPSNLFLLDFDSSKMTYFDNQTHKIIKNSDGEFIDKAGVRMKFNENSLLVLNDVYTERKFINANKLRGQSGSVLDLDYLTKNLFLLSDTLNDKSDYYSQFTVDGRVIITKVNHQSVDTVSSIGRWQQSMLNDWNLLTVWNTSTTCQTLILPEMNLTGFSAYLPQSDSLRKVDFTIVNSPIDLAHFAKKLVRKTWKVYKCSLPPGQQISKLKFTNKHVVLNAGMVSEKRGTWVVDKFGRVLICSFVNSTSKLDVIRLDKELVIDMDGITYFLK